MLSLPASPRHPSPGLGKNSPMNPRETIVYIHLHLATLYNSGLALRLLQAFGSPRGALEAGTAELLGIEGMSVKVKRRLRCKRTREQAKVEWSRCVSKRIRVLIHSLPGYPARLLNLEEMPLLLFSRGELAAADSQALAVVGSRRPTPYSLRQTRLFAGDLAGRGVTLVSGLARGVDACAHRAALEAGGRTIAVLGSGLGRIYPPENHTLADRVLAENSGVLVSEFPFSMRPRPYHFPQRNRLISGLSNALLVIQAGEKSGSLSTARWALDQGKNIFVLPSRVDEEHNRGGLHLLRDGAGVATSPMDLSLELGLTGIPVRGEKKTDGERRTLPGELGGPLETLFQEEDGWHPDALSARLGVPCSSLLAMLGRLELDGYLMKTSSGFYRLR